VGELSHNLEDVSVQSVPIYFGLPNRINSDQKKKAFKSCMSTYTDTELEYEQDIFDNMLQLDPDVCSPQVVCNILTYYLWHVDIPWARHLCHNMAPAPVCY
jgi:hypothetical protein